MLTLVKRGPVTVKCELVRRSYLQCRRQGLRYLTVMFDSSPPEVSSSIKPSVSPSGQLSRSQERRCQPAGHPLCHWTPYEQKHTTQGHSRSRSKGRLEVLKIDSLQKVNKITKNSLWCLFHSIHSGFIFYFKIHNNTWLIQLLRLKVTLDLFNKSWKTLNNLWCPMLW